ncbi:glycosyl hydrolase [Flammeovirga agarivorans]|uniref:T9SS type A sorting domain-containing protein n=1 Tax=Flammeovirga agarivorans TaxID=2726742 RepID=A0A7X8SKV7_9BACT|nr:glycosyl hydrolase [Flammeovirga agarivorans]NLR91973.1 T9SS type A sorting domain-containing protein [Flammeovirga agarivorans]
MKKLTLLLLWTLISFGINAQNCPPSHPFEACGRCWESAEQAASGGCNETQDPPEDTPPIAPTNLSTSNVTMNSVTLSWNDNSNDETGFEIYRDNSLISTTNANSTSFTESTLISNTTYSYYVIAVNGSLSSTQSNSVSVTTDQEVVENPNDLGTITFTSSDTGNGWIVEWNSVTNATQYVLNIVTLDGSAEIGNQNIVVTSLNYTEDNPVEDITYKYTLTVSNSSDSKVSNTITKIRTSCAGGSQNAENGKVSGKFTPKNGKALLFLGQDNNSVDGYTDSNLFPSIGGFTNYTNIYDFAGLESVNNYGSGDMCIQCGIDKHPSAAVAIGLYMVEDNDGVGEDHPNGLTDVVNGLYDASIDKFANFAKANPTTPFFLRVGYEFDGQWNHYEPTKYINAYRYLVDRLNAAGVENVAYVWQSAAYGFTYNSLPIDAWYPGDEYVDYIGLSFFFYDEGFNGPNLQFLLDMARTKQKPVMMAEVSAQYYDFDENTFANFADPSQKTSLTGQEMWEQYFEGQLLPFIQGNEDVIRAIAYINADWQSQEQWQWPEAGNGYWGDTRVERNTYVAQKWNEEISSGFYQNGDPNLYAILTTGCDNSETPIDPPVETKPSVPTNLVSSSQTTSSISLSWDAVSNASNYWVLYGTNSGSYVDSVQTSSSSVTINNLVADQNYYITMYATNSEGSSDLTNEIQVKTKQESTTPPPVGNKIEGKFTPKDGKTLLAIGQDLSAMSGYRNGNMPEPGAAVAYVAFYMLTQDNYGINYGATGMDNQGNFTDIDTDWGSGPLNASSTALGWDESALIVAMSITENWNLNGLQGIANGQYEQHIDKLALFCNKFPEKKIYLRIGYEFDGRWNSQETAGGDYPGGYHKQEEYKTAWRHIVDGMDARGVNNVAYVWQSSTSPVDDVLDGYFGNGGDLVAAREDIAGWYPGDDYVDWCGISWFISPTEASQYFGFDDVPNLLNQNDLADEMLAFAREHNKPVMIAEATPQGYDLEISEYDTTPSKVSRAITGYTYEGAKTLLTEGLATAEENYTPGTWIANLDAQEAWDRWFTPFLDYIHTNADVIRAVTYINANWNTQAKWASPYAEGYWGDTRIEENPAIKALWLEETNSEFWLLGSPSISDQLFDDASNQRQIQLAEELKETIKDITVYPNPARSIINIGGLEEKPVFQLINIQGQLMKTGIGQQIKITDLPKGLYLLKINDNITQKILIN